MKTTQRTVQQTPLFKLFGAPNDARCRPGHRHARVRVFAGRDCVSLLYTVQKSKPQRNVPYFCPFLLVANAFASVHGPGLLWQVCVVTSQHRSNHSKMAMTYLESIARAIKANDGDFLLVCFSETGVRHRH